MHKLLIKEKAMNWPLSVIVWLIHYFAIIAIFRIFGPTVLGVQILAMIVGALMTFPSLTQVKPLTRARLLFAGEEITEDGESIWLEPGYYFLFKLFGFTVGWSIFIDEIQTKQREEIKLPLFDLQDKNRKALKAKANATWAPGESDEEKQNYELMVDKEMPQNLAELLQQAINRILGSVDYWKNVLGKNVSSLILNDYDFKEECKKYGVYFKTLNLLVTSGDIKQDNINSYRKQLTAELKKMYKGLDDASIARMVDAQLGLSKRIDISGGASAVVRTDT